MNTSRTLLTLALLCAAVAGAAGAEPATEAGKKPLAIELPKPVTRGTPVPIALPNVEPAPAGKRPAFLAPAGSVLLSRDKPVTSSDPETVLNDFAMITDGDKSGDDEAIVVLHPGKQWVQIDLGQPSEIDAVLVWHYHAQRERVYHDVVIQVSDDPKFQTDVKTLFNNDTDNSLGLGVGQNRPYIENYQGKLINAQGARGRYVRLYSQGNTTNKMNDYIEVEVWGRPGK